MHPAFRLPRSTYIPVKIDTRRAESKKAWLRPGPEGTRFLLPAMIAQSCGEQSNPAAPK